jgi:hypothetical protein
MHELLHAVTGWTDDQIETSLGLPLAGQPGYQGSVEIGQAMMSCIFGN